MSLSRALDDLSTAIDTLERAVEAAGEDRAIGASGRKEVQRLNADRSALALELDASEARAKRLAESNQEVSRRLVAAMETIRRVVDQPSG